MGVPSVFMHGISQATELLNRNSKMARLLSMLSLGIRNTPSTSRLALAGSRIRPTIHTGPGYGKYPSMPVASTTTISAVPNSVHSPRRLVHQSAQALDFSFDFVPASLPPVKDLIYLMEKIEEFRTRFEGKAVKLLCEKRNPYLPRENEVEIVKEKFEELRQENPGKSVTVYVKGIAAAGKSQLAREYGERHNLTYLDRYPKLVVGTIDAQSRDKLERSYYKLAATLQCNMSPLTLAFVQNSPEMRLSALALEVQKELKERPFWLLIVDNYDTDHTTDWNPGKETVGVPV